MPLLILIIVSILISSNSIAQNQNELICKHINNQNGLMYGQINSIAQDKQGYIWFAGDEGLQRFDGYNFVNYFYNPTKPNETFPNGRLNKVAIDFQNKIWIGSFTNGFGYYNAYTNHNKLFLPTNQALLSANAVGYRDFLFSNDSVTYACSTDGLIKLINGHIVNVFSTNNSSLQGALIGRIAKDKNNNIWIGSLGGLNMLTNDEKHLYNHTNNKTIAAFANNILKDNTGNKAAIAEMYIDSKNNLWISSWKPELYCYNITTNTIKNITLPNSKPFVYDNMVQCFVEDNNGNLWIGTANNGIYKYNYTLNSFIHYLHDRNNLKSIGSNSISCMLKDKEGQIWLVSENNISIFNPTELPVTTILQNSSISATILVKDGSLWAADNNYLYQFNASLMQVKKIQHNQNEVNTVWKIKESLDQKEIFLLKEKGLSVFNKETEKIDAFNELTELRNNPVTDVIELNNKNLFLLRWWWNKNLLFLDRAQRSITPIHVPLYDKNNFEISCAIKKDSIHYYLFSKKGLMLLNSKTKYVTVLDAHFQSGNAILINNSFYSVTASSGIRVYNLNTKQTSEIGKFSGLPVNNTKNIVYAGDNEFWISSTSGIIKWNKEKNLFTIFRENFGINANHIAENSLSVLPNKSLVFNDGSLKMLTTISLRKYNPPIVCITQCIAGDSILTPEQLQKEVVIKHNNNVLQFQYAAINYNHNIQYQYMLEGYDKTWKNGDSRFVNYTNLSHGNYIFKVKAITEDGNWNKNITSIKIHVTQAFYKAIWFYILVLATVIGAILFYFKIRFNNLKKFQKLRNNISRDLHDEVGSTLSSISILSASVLHNMDKENQKSKELVTQIGHNAQNMLNAMDDIVWSINPKADTFESVILRMKEVANTLAEPLAIEVTFDYDESLNNENLPMLFKKNIYLIYKESIHNAIKYSGTKKIDVHLKKKHSKIVLTITDYGKGFDMSKEYNRNGLKNIKQRAEEINGKIVMQSDKDIGSSIQLIISL
jgi:signal transduction histidine kinase/ligand-binding sensor domain-containing protein